MMFSQFSQKVLRFIRSEDGPTAIEYALILMLIVLAALSGIVAIGESSATHFENPAEGMPDR